MLYITKSTTHKKIIENIIINVSAHNTKTNTAHMKNSVKSYIEYSKQHRIRKHKNPITTQVKKKTAMLNSKHTKPKLPNKYTA